MQWVGGRGMKLLLRRNQRAAVLGSKMVFTLEVRADLTADEKASIARYKLGDTVLYEKKTMTDRGSGLIGLASRAAFRAMNISVSVNDLAGGKKVECKDIVEMIAVIDQIKEAAELFKKLELGNTAYLRFELPSVDEKREALKLILSNLVADGKELAFRLQFPFDEIAKERISAYGGRWRARTPDLRSVNALLYQLS